MNKNMKVPFSHRLSKQTLEIQQKYLPNKVCHDPR